MGGRIMEVLLVVFITMKLTGVIDWSWVLVLAPLWVPIMVVMSIIVAGSIWCILVEYMGYDDEDSM